jgi:hypothetical protein
MLTSQLATQGVFGNLSDPDSMELFLRELDYPNYRAIIQVAKMKKKEAENKKYTIQDVLMNQAMAKSLTEFIDALAKAGRGNDISLILQKLGLTGKVDDLQTTPAKDITSRSDVKDVAAITAGKVSQDKNLDAQGRNIAAHTIVLERG